jgi:hypothetical protein
MARVTIKNLQEDIARLVRQNEILTRENDRIKALNDLLSRTNPFTNNQASTFLIAVERISDAMAHVISDLQRVSIRRQ